MSKTLVIGVGNAFRGDDGVGLIVAQQLRALAVDAVSSGSEPGIIHRYEATGQPLPTLFFGGSTHAFGLAEAIELARSLDRLPDQLVVYGVEGKAFELGTGLSPVVEAAAGSLVELISRELS